MKDTVEEEAHRRRTVAWAIAMTADTPLDPPLYEQELLEEYAAGRLTIEEVLHVLDSRVHHLVYHSQAVVPFAADQLTDLLEDARIYNAQHQLTGLLCYCDGHFVQLLEGPKEEVAACYARIFQDKRHHGVVVLRDGSQPTRCFTDWRMAFITPEPPEFYWLISYLEAYGSFLVVPQVPITDPHLMLLIQAFSQL